MAQPGRLMSRNVRASRPSTRVNAIGDEPSAHAPVKFRCRERSAAARRRARGGAAVPPISPRPIRVVQSGRGVAPPARGRQRRIRLPDHARQLRRGGAWRTSANFALPGRARGRGQRRRADVWGRGAGGHGDRGRHTGAGVVQRPRQRIGRRHPEAQQQRTDREGQSETEPAGGTNRGQHNLKKYEGRARDSSGTHVKTARYGATRLGLTLSPAPGVLVREGIALGDPPCCLSV
jgi:hypothetical protein